MSSIGWRPLLAAVVVLGAALRFSTLAQQSFWFDEAATVEIVRSGAHHAANRVAHGESTPPLYYALAWLWARVFGSSEAGLRSLSALVGTLTIPVGFVTGRRMVGATGGLLAAALVATNPILVWYSQEARAYALLALCASASFYFFVRALDDGDRRSFVGWAIAASLTVLSHYFGVFLVLAEAACLVARRRRTAIVTVLPVLAVTAALIPLVVAQHGNASGIAIPSRLGRVARIPFQFVAGLNISTVQVVGFVVVALVGGAALASAVSGVRLGVRRPLVVILAALLAPVVLAFAGLDYLNTRNELGVLTPLLVAAAALLVARPAAFVLTSAVCAVWVVLTLNVVFDPALQRTDLRGAAEALGRAPEPRAIVETLAGADSLDVYVRSLRPLPARGARVREIDLIGLSSHIGSNRDVIRARGSLTMPSGFHVSSQQVGRTYTLVRLESATARRFTVAAAGSLALPGGNVFVLLQR